MVSPSGEMTQPASDLDLLAAWRGGDAGAGNELVTRYYGPLLRFFELRSRMPEDLTQETLLACAASREAFRAEATFRSYVFGIARRVLLQSVSAHYHAKRMSSFDATPTARGTSLSALFARRQEQQFLLMVLASLPEDTQTLLALHYWENLRSREIAEVMGIPTSTVTSRLSRARQRLADGVRGMATAATSQTLLSDLEGWTRSLAQPDGVSPIPEGVTAAVARMLNRD